MTHELITAFSSADSRLLLLDYDGVLAPITKRPEDAAPSDEVRALLQTMATQPGTKAVVVSGRDRDTLERWLGNLPIDMAAEHGHFYRESGVWQASSTLDMSWRDDVRAAMEQLVLDHPGSHIEEKRASLVWHFRETTDTDEQVCEARIRKAADSRAEVMSGKCVIDVRARGADKGMAARHWYDSNAWDFVLCIGDDVTDEAMFVALPETVWTYKVGDGITAARGTLTDHNDVTELLRQLAASYT